MKNIALIFIFIFIAGCSTTQKYQEAVSQSVYATNDSISAERYDQAKFYSNKTTSLVQPPKKRIKIDPFISKTEDVTTKKYQEIKYIVLPSGSSKDILVKDSPEYLKILGENKQLRKQILEEQKVNDKLESQIDQLLIKQKNELDNLKKKQEEDRREFWGKVKFWGVLGGGTVGLIALLIFFPALIPVLSAIIAFLGTLFKNIVEALTNLIKKE